VKCHHKTVLNYIIIFGTKRRLYFSKCGTNISPYQYFHSQQIEYRAKQSTRMMHLQTFEGIQRHNGALKEIPTRV